MMKFVVVCCSVLAVALAANFEYLDNVIEYDVSPNMVSAMPYPYNGGFRGNKVIDFEPSPAYSAVVPSVLETEEPKTELVATKVGLLASGAFYVIALVKKAVFFIFKNWSALALGSTIALGICKFTALCNKNHSLLELQREIRAYATPQRLARAAEMVESAVKKYNAMQ